MKDLSVYASINFIPVGPYEGIISVEKRLLNDQFLVVKGEDDDFLGILTSADVLRRPHKLVIDCITNKESITNKDSLSTVLSKFKSNQTFVLPFMDGTEFKGVIEKDTILSVLEKRVIEFFDKTLIAEKAKTEFLNNLSHEIRTPLNGVMGFMDIITELDELKINSVLYKEKLWASVDQFLSTMMDVIDLSLLVSGEKLRINLEPVDLVILFSEICDNIKTQYCDINPSVLTLSLFKGSSFHVITDKEKLRRVLHQLMSNAIKFTDEGSILYGFSKTPDDTHFNICIRNRSSDVLNMDIHKMMNVFQKQETIKEKLNPGMGIGLPLAKHLTTLLGGVFEIMIEENELIIRVAFPVFKGEGCQD